MNTQQDSYTDTARRLRAEAKKFIAGGVVSLNRKVNPDLIFTHASGSMLFDTEGKTYIDYHAAFAPHLLGHNNQEVNSAVVQAMRDLRSLTGSGTSESEVRLASTLCNLIPSLEKIQVTNTGSEATAHAIRLSRAYTGREDIVLVLGGYNGWHNEVSRAVMPSLQQVGPRVSPGEYPFVPLSAGIPSSTKRLVHIVNFNDLESLEYVFRRYPVACVLTEPVLQNIGVVLPAEGYLSGLISLCKKYGVVSIFDEVKTGFRSHLKGYQHIANLSPDLSVFGKAIANGFPLGVIGGRADIMDLFDSPDPSRRVLIAGTYNAHPFNVAAALATIDLLRHGNVYQHLDKVCQVLYDGLNDIFNRAGIPAVVSSNGSAFCVYFMDHAPADLHDILLNHDFQLDVSLRKAGIAKGIYHIPIACKQGSVSYAHTMNDITSTLEITSEIIQKGEFQKF